MDPSKLTLMKKYDEKGAKEKKDKKDIREKPPKDKKKDKKEKRVAVLNLVATLCNAWRVVGTDP